MAQRRGQFGAAPRACDGSRAHLTHGAWLAVACALTLTACASDDGGDGGDKAAPAAAASGGFSVTIDGTTANVDYAGGKVETEIVHKLNPDKTGYGCITTLLMRVAKADGTCQLELRYQPVGGELVLADATFAAALGIKQGGVIVKTEVCAGFPGVAGKQEVLYTLSGGKSTLQTGPVEPPEASETEATLADRTLRPSGKITLTYKSKLFEFDTSKIEIKGTLKSTGSDAVSCGAAVGTEVCPTGVTYGDAVGSYVRRPGGAYLCDDSSAYDLGESCGKPLMLLTYNHWVTNPQRNPGADNFGGKEVMEGLGALHTKYGKDVGFAVVVLSGDKRVVIEDIANTGTFHAGGPAPTPEDCAKIRELYGIPEGVVMLYDKDKALNSSDKRLIGAKHTPAVATADSKGAIVAILPGDDGNLTKALVETAIDAAIAAN